MGSPATALAFDAEGVAHALRVASDQVLDALEFGVVELDRPGTVLRYNATESRYSGLSAERVVGRSFFVEVAPCSNNRKVARRYDEASIDETITYTFAFRMKQVPVVLRMLKPADAPVMYLLVRWA